MRRSWSSIVAAMALVAAAAACERPGDVARGPESILAPSAAIIGNVAFTTDAGYTLLTGPANAAQTSRSTVLGYNGGKLAVGANQLVVPYGAVPEATRFTITMVNKPYLVAKLSAVRVSDGAQVTQFAVPLGLRISYAKSPTPIPDPSKLTMFSVADGVVVGSQPTSVDVKGQTVYADIWHFSEYSPGLDP